MNTKPRAKTCRNKACAEKFTPSKPLQSACCIGCAIIVGRDKIKADALKVAKLDRAITKQKLEAIKPRSKWMAEAQQQFNGFIRARDAAEPCISCGRFHSGAYDAGHYRSVGAMSALRFNEDNCHRQCVPCNQHKAGNIVDYRIRLAEKIGTDRLAFLELDHPIVKLTIDEIKAIKTEYQARLKLIQQNKTPASLERSGAFTNDTRGE